MFGFGRHPVAYDLRGLDGFGRRPQLRREEALRRDWQAQMEARRRAARQQQLRQREREAERQKARAERLREATAAAVVIQRLFREYRQRKRDAASLVITRAVRDRAACNNARRIAASIRRLRRAGDEISQLKVDYENNPVGYRATLCFVDRLEKITFALDAVPTYGSGFVRHFRKAVVAEAQAGMGFADVRFAIFRRRVALIERAVGDFLRRKREARRDKAARCVTRTIRAVPLVRKAKADAAAISMVREKRRRLLSMEEEYRLRLQELMASVSAMQSDNDTFSTLQAGLLQDTRQTLAGLHRRPIAATTEQVV